MNLMVPERSCFVFEAFLWLALHSVVGPPHTSLVVATIFLTGMVKAAA